MSSSLGYKIRAGLIPQSLKNPGVDGSADEKEELCGDVI